MPIALTLTRLQGVYYLVTGLWPLVHFASFEALSGRKRDRWLVRTVGLLAAVIGLALLRRPAQSRQLADLSAAAFAISDVQAFRAGQLPTYLMDAAGEVALIIGRGVRS